MPDRVGGHYNDSTEVIGGLTVYLPMREALHGKEKIVMDPTSCLAFTQQSGDLEPNDMAPFALLGANVWKDDENDSKVELAHYRSLNGPFLRSRFQPWRGARKQPSSLNGAFPLLNAPFSDLNGLFPRVP